MSKPVHQKVIIIIGYILAGIFGFGVVLDAVSNAFNLITKQLAIWITLLIIVSYMVLLALLKKRKIKWEDKNGQLLTIKQLGKIHWYLLGCLMLLWMPIFFGSSKSKSTSSISHYEQPKNINSVFDSSDRRFKILVLPFYKECNYEDKLYDIGYVICKRLETLNYEDTLNLVTHYFTGSLDLLNFTSEKADSIRKNHKADQILYGSYSLKGCEATSDKICFNYITATDKWDLGKKQTKIDYQMIDLPGLDALRKGYGQEDIDYVIYFVAGISDLRENKFIRAIHRFKSIKSFEKYDKIEVFIGLCYHFLKDYANAILSYKKALKLNSNNILALNNLGGVYMDLQKVSKSKDYFEKALKVEPDNEAALDNLGTVYQSLKNFPKAFENYKKALEINPNNDQVLYNLGALYYVTKDFVLAKDCFIKSLNRNRNEDIKYFYLGLTYEKLDDLQNAKECYKKTLNIDSNNLIASVRLGVYYRDLKDFQNAKDYFGNAVKINSNSDRLWRDLGDSWFALKNYSNAKPCFENAVRINPKNNLAWNSLGTIYGISGDVTNAKLCFEKALIADPKEYSTLYNLAWVYSIDRNAKMVIFYLKQAIASNALMKSQAKMDPQHKWLWANKDFIDITN